MDFSTPEEGRKLLQQIQHKIKKLEESQKKKEIELYFVKQNAYNLIEEDTCYLAIYISGGHGGIVKVKLEKRCGNYFHFISVDNDIFYNIQEWAIVKRPNHPYLVIQMDSSCYIEPIPYSNVDNIRTVELLQLKA